MKLPRIFRDESGQALIFIMVALPCLLGIVGLAVDVGDIFHTRRVMQTTADAAAIAAASELKYPGDTCSIACAAQAAAIQNGITNGSNGATVVVHNGPTTGPYAGNSAYVEVIASQTKPTYFMNIFNLGNSTVSARAVAGLGNGQGCIFTLGGATTPGITLIGNASISVATCGVSDNGNLIITGNDTVTALSIGVAGTYRPTGNVHVTPTPVTGIAPVSDPLAYLPAPPVPSSCTGAPTTYNGNQTVALQPGCYLGLGGNGNITLNLSPGTYVINGNLNFSGNVTLTGTGVTLDLLGNVGLPGNVSLNLTAPTSGTYSGILIYAPETNTNTIALTGNAGSVVKGIIYAPGAPVTFTGNSGSTIYTDFVSSSLSLVGNASFQSYAALPGVTSPIQTPRLVE